MNMLVFQRNKEYVFNTQGRDTCRSVMTSFNRPPDSMCSIEGVRERPLVRYDANRGSSTVALCLQSLHLDSRPG